MAGRKKEALSRGSRRRLRQLVVCLVLCGVVLAGRWLGVAPVVRWSERAAEMVGTDADFHALVDRGREVFLPLWEEVTHEGH